MSGQSGNDILCFAAGCGFKGNSGRLFDHFRKVHRAEDWPRSWIERFRLSQCPKCLPWYSRLISHTPKCYATRPSCASAAVGAVAAVDFVIPSPGVTHASQDIATPTSQQITDDNSHHNPQLTPPVPSIISPLSPQDQAWHFVSTLSLDDILGLPVAATVQDIPSRFQAVYRDCAEIPLKKISVDPSDENAWKLLLLLPRMILSRRSCRSSVRQAYNDFVSYRWGELIYYTSPKRPRRCPDDQLRRKAALRLCRCGELSRAARALTSCGIAYANEDTIQRLRSKHPLSYSSDGEFENFDSASFDSVELPRDIIVNALQRSPRGSSAGCPGWRFEHLKMLLSGVVTGNLLIEVLSLIAAGRFPEFASRALSASRLIALPKSNGDVRPIAV